MSTLQNKIEKIIQNETWVVADDELHGADSAALAIIEELGLTHETRSQREYGLLTEGEETRLVSEWTPTTLDY